MKSFSDFEINKVEEPLVEKYQEESLLEAVDYVNENQGMLVEAKDSDPPPVLILRRKSIRVFPNNQKVALYLADKINKYIVVPYDNNTMSASIKEQLDQATDIIGGLKDIAGGYKRNIMLENGDWINVDVMTAKSIIHIYENLNRENKKILVENLSKNKSEFKKVVDFANKHK